MNLEVRVRMLAPEGVTRHYVVEGHIRALCGRLTLRAPEAWERKAPLCRHCDANADALFRRGQS